jgi:hypothetical protein
MKRRQKTGVRQKPQIVGGTGVFIENVDCRGHEIPMLDICHRAPVQTLLQYLFGGKNQDVKADAQTAMCSLLGMNTRSLMKQRQTGLVSLASCLADESLWRRGFVRGVDLFLEPEEENNNYVVQKYFKSGLEATCVAGMTQIVYQRKEDTGKRVVSYKDRDKTKAPDDAPEKGIWIPLLVLTLCKECPGDYILLGYGSLKNTQQNTGTDDDRLLCNAEKVHALYNESEALQEAVAWVSMLQCIGVEEKRVMNRSRTADTDLNEQACFLDSLIENILDTQRKTWKGVKTHFHYRNSEIVESGTRRTMVLDKKEFLWQAVTLAVQTHSNPVKFEMVVVFPKQKRILSLHEWAFSTSTHLLHKTILVDILQKRMGIDTDLAKSVVHRTPAHREILPTRVLEAMLRNDRQVIQASLTTEVYAASQGSEQKSQNPKDSPSLQTLDSERTAHVPQAPAEHCALSDNTNSSNTNTELVYGKYQRLRASIPARGLDQKKGGMGELYSILYASKAKD